MDKVFVNIAVMTIKKPKCKKKMYGIHTKRKLKGKIKSGLFIRKLI
jgi:hypothetical protein